MALSKTKKETSALLRFMLHISHVFNGIPDAHFNFAVWHLLQRNGAKVNRIKCLGSLSMFHNMQHNSTQKDINSC
jgi:hypothetical protein